MENGGDSTPVLKRWRTVVYVSGDRWHEFNISMAESRMRSIFLTGSSVSSDANVRILLARNCHEVLYRIELNSSLITATNSGLAEPNDFITSRSAYSLKRKQSLCNAVHAHHCLTVICRPNL
jgi:hypothetical protein